MATHAPIITNLSSPAIQVVSVSDLAYNTLNNSIGASIYAFENLYQWSSSLNQLLEPIYLKKFNKNGNKEVQFLNMVVDPYQFTSALNQTAPVDYIFDSNNSFQPRILPNVATKYRIDIRDFERQDLLTKGSSNFGNLDFYMDYEIDF